jgi:hypothetical protein
MLQPRLSFRAAAAVVLIPVLFLVLIAAIALLAHPEMLVEGGPSIHSLTGEPRLFALILAAGAAALGWQLYRTSHKGYVYCGRTEYVNRSESTLLYHTWIVIHCLFIAVLSAFAVILYRA